ncbi:MAG TPA: nickel pincer cofactor biosynthesis protein LarB [Candidatus Brocadiia bacterium]|nr:nickel pincer cofactor biosynthesis protein LarB [Planctomycetota bacterium]MDO8093175.1 nickel pincer cofactor biosynthesis protein LarB [Candidatus Brocadiales bacterium]
MDISIVKDLLKKVKEGKITVEGALKRLKSLPFSDLGFAKVDAHRSIRCGFPEVIFCQGKTTKQIIEIAGQILKGGSDLLATRANEAIYKAILERYPDAQFNELAKTITIKKTHLKIQKGLILIISAGTSDIPVAEEARVTAEIMGNRVETLYDVGVAGIHRLFKSHKELLRANVIIVVAGMEGALASVVGGLVERPVIAVPTSVGYGASFLGIAPLLTMLNSCAAGVAVVNIDNGFGAGYVASLINQEAKIS